MSADNWTTCYACKMALERKVAESIALHEAEAREAYGTASLDEYERIREIATKAIECERNRKLEQTFREDYEFYGADEGIVTVSYRGHCTECGYGIDIKEDYPIPGGES